MDNLPHLPVGPRRRRLAGAILPVGALAANASGARGARRWELARLVRLQSWRGHALDQRPGRLCRGGGAARRCRRPAAALVVRWWDRCPGSFGGGLGLLV